MATVQVASEETKRMLREGYNSSASRYLDWVRTGHAKGWEIRLATLERLFGFLGISLGATSTQLDGEGKTVLDLGCGAGDPITLMLAANPAISKVVANDQSSTQLELLSQGMVERGIDTNKVELRESDMAFLSLPAGSLDAAVAYYSIIHLPQLEQPLVVRKIHESLKPGGYFLSCFATDASEGNVMEDWHGMKCFWSSWGTEGNIDMVKDAGFKIVWQDVVDDLQDASFLWLIGRKL